MTTMKTRLTAAQRNELAAAIEEARIAGLQCSNCCYNLAQWDEMTEAAKRSMRESYKRWVAADSRLVAAVKACGGIKKGGEA